MAKQRRGRPTPATPQIRNAGVQPAAARSASEPEPIDPGAERRREVYVQAVTLYERGMHALQHREYGHATKLLRSVLEQFPDELDLHERVHLYLKVCERQAAPAEATPRSLQERLYAATLALNDGSPDVALAHLQAILRDDSKNDFALYMLALVHVSRNEPEAASLSLQQSIALNPENRALARQDPDLEPLRQNPEIRSLLDSPAGAAYRRSGRGRLGH